jgi:hypothetical protein
MFTRRRGAGRYVPARSSSDRSAKKLPTPGALDVGDGYTVNTRCSSVVTDVTPRLPQDAAAGDVVIKGVEARLGSDLALW